MLSYGSMPFYSALPTSNIRRSTRSGQVPKVISRYLAMKWLASPASKQTGVVATEFPGYAWWSGLSRYRFLLSPMGDEIQAPKNVEALLVLTIPIIQRGPYSVAHDLQGLGFPVVVLDEWEEITPSNLSAWWRALSPRLPSFRANCLTTAAFWRMMTGETASCH
uniref:Uncharacterized protein n=1 Tax=Alexandrium catenella TaxID=2925 RepID=A0A7S1LJ66_ALECA